MLLVRYTLDLHIPFISNQQSLGNIYIVHGTAESTRHTSHNGRENVSKIIQTAQDVFDPFGNAVETSTHPAAKSSTMFIHILSLVPSWQLNLWPLCTSAASVVRAEDLRPLCAASSLWKTIARGAIFSQVIKVTRATLSSLGCTEAAQNHFVSMNVICPDCPHLSRSNSLDLGLTKHPVVTEKSPLEMLRPH